MTLKRFISLVERYKERVKREDRRAGEIVAILFNANRDPDKVEGVDWQDVFPEWKEPKTQEQIDTEFTESLLAWAESTRGLEPST